MGYKTRRSPGRFCRALLLLPFPCWDTSSAYTAEYPIPLTVAALETPALPGTATLGNMAGNIMRTSGEKIVTHYTLHLRDPHVGPRIMDSLNASYSPVSHFTE